MASGNARIGRFDPQKRHFHSMVSWNMISLNQIFQGQLRQRIHHNTPGLSTQPIVKPPRFKPPQFFHRLVLKFTTTEPSATLCLEFDGQGWGPR